MARHRGAPRYMLPPGKGEYGVEKNEPKGRGPACRAEKKKGNPPRS